MAGHHRAGTRSVRGVLVLPACLKASMLGALVLLAYRCRVKQARD
jgi:hypothetical protein